MKGLSRMRGNSHVRFSGENGGGNASFLPDTLQQASRRSWRIGQKLPVKVIFLGYAGTSQIACLELMAKKIAVSQSTSGDVPDSGLDVLNQDGDSIEIALARRLATEAVT